MTGGLFVLVLALVPVTLSHWQRLLGTTVAVRTPPIRSLGTGTTLLGQHSRFCSC